jgi:hypothetical protein
MASDLIFEKVGDVNSTYPYLCVYLSADKLNPFMEISVNDLEELQFVIYAFPKNVSLTAAQWGEIRKRADAFLPLALADEGTAE